MRACIIEFIKQFWEKDKMQGMSSTGLQKTVFLSVQTDF